MVEEQLIPRGINDKKVIEAFLKVPRHLFVPEEYVHEAYGDYPLPIGYGQTISQPYIVALMTQLLELNENSKVLEIGTGSGYQAAILAEVCGEVYTVERDLNLTGRVKETLKSLDYGDVKVKTSDGTLGWEEKAPFDGILVTAASPAVPEPLKKQLKEGGRLVIPVGPAFSQVLVRLRKKGEEVTTESVCGCVFVPLVGEHGWSE